MIVGGREGGEGTVAYFLRPIAAKPLAERSPAKFFVQGDTSPPAKKPSSPPD